MNLWLQHPRTGSRCDLEASPPYSIVFCDLPNIIYIVKIKFNHCIVSKLLTTLQGFYKLFVSALALQTF